MYQFYFILHKYIWWNINNRCENQIHACLYNWWLCTYESDEDSLWEIVLSVIMKMQRQCSYNNDRWEL